MTTIYGYIRVSSDAQADSGLGLAAQGSRIKEEAARIAKRHKLAVGKIFRDAAISATRTAFFERPGGRELNRWLQTGDHVVIAKLDRAFRSQRDCVITCDAWMDRGVIVHILDLGMDTDTPTGRMMLGLLSSIAQWEAARIGERMRDALIEVRRAGRASNGHRILGYSIGRNGQLSPLKSERAAGRRAAKLRADGLLLHEIAARLTAEKHRRAGGKKWNPQAVNRLIFALRSGWPIYTLPAKIAARKKSRRKLANCR